MQVTEKFKFILILFGGVSTTLIHAQISNINQVKRLLNSETTPPNVELSSINHQLVLTDDGASSSTSIFLYFLSKNAKQYFVSQVIGETETTGVLNNFVVRNIHAPLTTKTFDLGYTLQDKTDLNIQSLEASRIAEHLEQKKVVQIKMGQIGKYKFSMQYQNINQFMNRESQYRVTCNGQSRRIKPYITVYMGYDADDLQKSTFIAIKDGKSYRYLEGETLDKFLNKHGISCR